MQLSAVDPRSPLHREVSKESLLSALPFFGEEILTMGPVRDLDRAAEDEWEEIDGDSKDGKT